MSKKIDSQKPFGEKRRQYCYWDDRLEIQIAILNRNLSSKDVFSIDRNEKIELAKGTKVQVLIDPKSGYNLFVRCKVGNDDMYHIKFTDLIFKDNTLEKMIKEYRAKLIKKGLIVALNGFDTIF